MTYVVLARTVEMRKHLITFYLLFDGGVALSLHSADAVYCVIEQWHLSSIRDSVLIKQPFTSCYPSC